MNILLLGESDDYQLQHLAQALTLTGANPHIVDTQGFPAEHSISWCPTRGTGYLRTGTAQLAFADIHAVYWHKFLPPKVREEMPAKEQHIARQDSVSALNSLFLYHPVNWVNGIEAIRYHQSKPVQLRHAQALGAKIPDTCIGNDVVAAKDFLDRHSEVIIKPVYGGATASLITRQQRQSDYLARALCLAPLTLQEYIGGTNIRTYVCDGKVFSAELYSKHTDFRTDTETTAVVVELPLPVASLSRILCSEMGMKWCAIDWRRDLQGNYWFLEINPCPYFTYFEKTTGHKITEALVNLLLKDGELQRQTDYEK